MYSYVGLDYNESEVVLTAIQSDTATNGLSVTASFGTATFSESRSNVSIDRHICAARGSRVEGRGRHTVAAGGIAVAVTERGGAYLHAAALTLTATTSASSGSNSVCTLGIALRCNAGAAVGSLARVTMRADTSDLVTQGDSSISSLGASTYGGADSADLDVSDWTVRAWRSNVNTIGTSSAASLGIALYAYYGSVSTIVARAAVRSCQSNVSTSGAAGVASVVLAPRRTV